MEILEAFKRALSDIKGQREAQYRDMIREAISDIVREEFSKLPENKKATMVKAMLESGDMTDELLRRFVQTCPKDKYVEVSFPKGERILIMDKAPEKRGPGW